MKQIKCVIVLALLLSTQVRAQADSLQLKLDSIFQYVDKSQVPGGFLQEYGTEFTNLKRFNGVLTDSNIVNAMAWHYIYADVYSSKIYGTNTLLTPDSNYTVFNNEAIANAGINPVSMLALQYSSIKSYAVSSNLLSVSNSRFYDVSGRPENPYQLNTAFAAAPFYETDNDGTLSLIFKQNLFINTTGKTVSNIQVNFDDGNGFVTAAWDSVITANYEDTGTVRITVKLTFTDATNLQCYSNVRILRAYEGASRYQPTTATMRFNPTGNNHSGGDITIQYSVNNTSPGGNRKFQKPFIVVEGFDMHDAAPLLMESGYDYNDFLKEITDIIFQSNGKSFNFNLDDIAGYDLVFLNYRDGTDSIERNVRLLQEVITWVNSNKDVGAAQNVVMGISMGGLVSRYCLAKMTKENNSPQTRLLITHDSPHRGANIPLGMQYLINDFANQHILGLKMREWIPLFRQVVALQLRPATMQQLFVRDNPDTRSLEYNTFLASNSVYRQMVTFSSSDIQPAYEFIATSQGSQCGVPVMAPSTEMLHSSANAGYHFIFGGFGTKFSGEVDVHALPNGTASQRITYFVLKQTDRFLWIPFTTTRMHFEHYSPSGILGYDGASAGTQFLSRGTGAGNIPGAWGSGPWFIPSFIFEYYYNFLGLTIVPAFSFVPAASALDEDITATSLYASHQGMLYTPPANAPLLQKYIAQEETTIGGVNVSNITHTDFTARNAHWIYNEMEGNSNDTLNCSSECLASTLSISGLSNFCAISTAYTVTGLPSGATVTWSAYPTGVATINTPGASQTTLTKATNGTITLTATISGLCGSPIAVHKTVAINNAATGSLVRELDLLNYDCDKLLLYGSSFGNNEQVVWTTTNGLLINGQSSPYTSIGGRVEITSPLGSGGAVQAASQNGCTQSTYTYCPCVAWSGNPGVNWIWSSPTPAEPLQAYVYPEHPDAVKYIWFVGDQIIQEGTSNYLSAYSYPCTWEKELMVIAVTDCGTSAPVSGGTYSPLCYGYRETVYRNLIAPNPAGNIIMISVKQQTGRPQTEQRQKEYDSFKMITVSDVAGNIKKRISYVKGTRQAQINISNLYPGTYIVEITDGSFTERQQLLIQR